jgi:predicted alpha/beta-hydrolase family hydrolase
VNEPPVPKLVFNGPASAKWTVILAHGAGAGMLTPFMNAFAEGLAEHGLRVVRFEFPYMADRTATGRARPPDAAAVLCDTWHRVISPFPAQNLVIGGKSMGGRIASMIADDAAVAGLVCLGYPFHPPGRPGQLRIDHLRQLRTRALFLQGERDPFGTREEVASYELSPQIQVRWLADGDHSFKPRKASGTTEAQNWHVAIGAIVDFMAAL